MAMEATNYSSSSYEVLLSFRGADTREHLANPLGTGLTGAGISVFRDKRMARADKEIDPALVEAIGQSKISIPIISPEYASSKGCLVVLDKMLDFMDAGNYAIIPIFYKLNPSDIGSFVDHKKRGIDGKLLSWKSALHRIGQLEGYHLDHAKEQPISEIVLYVTRQLKKAELVGTSMPIGIDNQVREMMKRLAVDYSNGQAVEIPNNEVRMVVIHGIGGIGKTTLAKFVYNQLYPLFEGCSYLGNIGEISKTEPLEHLQSQLISDLLKQDPKSFDSLGGINFIKKRFLNMRVLIVLDDVNEQHHLEAFAGKLSWFGSRSRIIVTTRNADLLNIPKEVEIYEVEPIDFDESLRLFCLHAFGGSSPDENYDNLSGHIVSSIGRLPIAIEVLGSFLYRKDIRIWIETLQKLKEEEEASDTVQKVLTTSYEALDQKTKDIFLDIACLFIGKDKRIPFYMWEDCGLNPHSGVESLVLTSLVKIEENNELSVYDLLREFGRTIVLKEDLTNPGRRSRLWDHEEALKILSSREVKIFCFAIVSMPCFLSDSNK
ncbi:disease resistance protein L6-like [Syzygium oleosum]|uniref:disease resistance protein L6-like n=1 Tax=Syzygium oleosum TaxID=219896 RepID=UPI0011D1B438|nr:disease resistance protein L6-like [Syzygium oleosum]